MSAIIEKIKAHYQSQPRREIAVPEWGADNKPFLVTWTPLTVRDEERIFAYTNGAAPSGSTIRLRAVMFKACDAGGARLFSEMDEHTLRFDADSRIIGRIADAMLFADALADKDGKLRGIDEQVDDAKNA